MTAQTTIVGNTTADVELRFTPAGAAVANFTIASTEKVFNKQTEQWVDGKKLFLRCTAWREMAENIAESISKGTRVIAKGKISSREYETREGEKRTVVELEVDEIGPSLKYATAKPNKADRKGGGSFGTATSKPTQDDPWGATPPANDSEAPF